MRTLRVFAAIVVVLGIGEIVAANAFVRGAYYRLGDDDPGAAAGNVGNDPTKDSFSDGLDLSRFSSPHYSADVPARGPVGNKLSMAFANSFLNEQIIPGAYGRTKSLDMIDQGYALEAWVKSPDYPVIDDGPDFELIAYNGDRTANNGFGFYREVGSYVARVGSFEQVLGLAGDGAWHHLAYVRSFNNVSYYYDGKLVKETTSDPIPIAASGGFWVGGRSTSTGLADPFNGWVDEVRYQSFNPIAAGAFEPTNFLISVPEPAAGLFCVMALMAVGSQRGFRSR